jgi:hypothetical protein
VLSSAGTQDVNNNAIVGTFCNSNSASGTLTLFTSAASSVSGSVTNNNNNNFSNITVSGPASILGWVNTDAGSGTKNIQNNTFSKWTGLNSPTGAFTALTVNITGTTNAVSDNKLTH